MKKEMIENLNEDTLRVSPEQEAWLDQNLTSEGQAKVAALVQALPEDDPGLMWRSELSGRLHQVAVHRQKRQRVSWTLRPALGIGAAALLAVVFVSRNAPTVEPAPSPRVNVEAQVLGAHREAVQLATFWGSVRVDEEARNSVAPASSEYQWDESDLGTL